MDEQGWEQALWEAQALASRERVWTERMVHLGARAGHGGPVAKCFEKERMMLFQRNDFVLPRLILSLLVHVKHRSIQVLF